MALADPVQVKFPEDVLTEVDEYAEKMRAIMPGAVLRRADALRVLVVAGLAAERERLAKQVP